MIKLDPEYNVELKLSDAVEAFKQGKYVLLAFADENGEVYAAQVLTKGNKYLSLLRDIPFEDMVDAKYYIKGDNHEKTD